MKNKLGMSFVISHKDKYALSKQIELFSKTGFDSFFLSSGVTEQFDIIPMLSVTAKNNNIEFEAVHAPSKGLDSLWEFSSPIYQESIFKIIDYCNLANVNKLVMHVAVNPDTNLTLTGIKNFNKIEHYAKQAKIHICYENSYAPKHLAEVLNNSDPFHGLCFDVGHYFCSNNNINVSDLPLNRLMYTHIHDNYGFTPPKDVHSKDMHLLPYDGKINWDKFAEIIKNSNYEGTLNLELSCYHKKEYNMISYDTFVTEAYSCLKKIQQALL